MPCIFINRLNDLIAYLVPEGGNYSVILLILQSTLSTMSLVSVLIPTHVQSVCDAATLKSHKLQEANFSYSYN